MQKSEFVNSLSRSCPLERVSYRSALSSFDLAKARPSLRQTFDSRKLDIGCDFGLSPIPLPWDLEDERWMASRLRTVHILWRAGLAPGNRSLGSRTRDT